MSLTHAELKALQRAERDGHSEGLALRVHRALSWLYRSEQADDDDAKFLFLWISLCSSHAQSLEGERFHERKAIHMFLEKLVELDVDQRLYRLVWNEFSGPIRVLLDNQFVYEPFWEFHRGNLSEIQWKTSFEKAKIAANRALAERRTADALSIVLSRLYTLRNQIVHGGATWNSKVNREQMRDCTGFLEKLVPYVIWLMLDNPKTLWGEAVYPVIDP